MGIFNFFRKDKKVRTEKNMKLFNPVNGIVTSINEVADPVFAQKMMGDGFGVQPTDGEIYSPVDAKIMSVFPTKHALGLKLDNGIDLLLHIGVDTIDLEGKPFEILVEEGERVTPDTLLIKADLAALKEAGKPDTIIVVFTNMEIVKQYSLSSTGKMKRGEEIGEISAGE